MSEQKADSMNKRAVRTNTVATQKKSQGHSLRNTELLPAVMFRVAYEMGYANGECAMPNQSDDSKLRDYDESWASFLEAYKLSDCLPRLPKVESQSKTHIAGPQQ